MIVTVKNIVPLFKGTDPATNIELLQFNEVDYEVVRQKGLNQVGDKLYLILPDYNLPNTELFADYVAPDGDPKKSKLGSKNRVRAVKFNFHRGDNLPVYSNGILLEFTDDFIYDFSYEDFGIYKHVEEESVKQNTGGSKSSFPQGLYKTDENNILNVSMDFPNQYIGTLKVDGSSITIWATKNKSGIASRTVSKPLQEKVIVGKRKPTWFEKILMFFNRQVNLSIYELRDATNDFVVIGKPYLEKLEKFVKDNDFVGFALRGELCGQNLRGSGNKHNPHANLEKQILFFGADVYNGYAYEKLDEESFSNLVKALDLPRCPIIFNQFFKNKEELYNECNSYFKDNLVEGIVVRNLETTFSVKVMNFEYDAKKD